MSDEHKGDSSASGNTGDNPLTPPLPLGCSTVAGRGHNCTNGKRSTCRCCGDNLCYASFAPAQHKSKPQLAGDMMVCYRCNLEKQSRCQHAGCQHEAEDPTWACPRCHVRYCGPLHRTQAADLHTYVCDVIVATRQLSRAANKVKAQGAVGDPMWTEAERMALVQLCNRVSFLALSPGQEDPREEQ